MVVLKPVPAIAPGLMVQLPAGKTLNTTLPVATAQVGWVMVPTVGANGIVVSVMMAFPVIGVVKLPFVPLTVYIPAS